MTFWEYLDAKRERKDARFALLIDHGLDWRSLGKSFLAAVDAKIVIALIIVGMFARAYIKNPDDTMKGALIAAFAGAWGYYLGSSNTAKLANDRADSAIQLGHEALKQLPPPPGSADQQVQLKPGETAEISTTEKRDGED